MAGRDRERWEGTARGGEGQEEVGRDRGRWERTVSGEDELGEV